MNQVTVIGLGYVGLPTALVAAKNGFRVAGYDIDSVRVLHINNGNSLFKEPSLNETLREVLAQNLFFATTEISPADYFIIAVPTPFNEKKEADLTSVWNATHAIAKVLKKGNTVLVESTIPVGTTIAIAQELARITQLRLETDFFVAYCPERVLPGKILQELQTNTRIIGGTSQESGNHAAKFYRHFVNGEICITNSAAAELVKLVENSSRDVAVAFAQEVASIAYTLNLNPFEIIELANKHPRVKLLQPSVGVGGHCIAVDPWFLIEQFPHRTTLLRTARHVNDSKPLQVIEAIKSHIHSWQNEHEQRANVLLLGLTYKPDVNDLRESPALMIATTLTNLYQEQIIVYEPNVQSELLIQDYHLNSVPFEEAIEQADIVVCLVRHTLFTRLSQKLLHKKMALDFCGAWYKSHESSKKEAFLYWPANSTANITLNDEIDKPKRTLHPFTEHIT